MKVFCLSIEMLHTCVHMRFHVCISVYVFSVVWMEWTRQKISSHKINMADSMHPILLFCSALTSVNSLPKEHQNLEKTSLSTLLYSNVRGLHQASGEISRVCLEFYPSVVCLSETHLCGDAPDSFCPPGYVVAARRDRSKHGGGILILIQEHILFEEIDTAAFSTAESATHSLLFVCCYRQPSSADMTLITNLDHLLDTYPSVCKVGLVSFYTTCWTGWLIALYFC